MIFKFIGMILVFVSSSLIGFGFAECMASRERELDNLSDGIDMMLSELTYSALPMRDIVSVVTPRVCGMAGEMLEFMCSLMDGGDGISVAWEEAVSQKAYAMSLRQSDRDILVRASYLFEEYELEEQKKSLLRLRDKLSSMCCDAGEEKRKNSKIVKMLGVYGGILLCIILL